MKNLIIAALVVAIAAAFVNDVARYGKARYDLSTIALETADSLATERSESRDTNARAAARFASERGATVYMYDQDDSQVHVWVQMPVEGTWVLGPAMALVAGHSIRDPYYIQAEDTAYFR